jgi:hypothetical protein
MHLIRHVVVEAVVQPHVRQGFLFLLSVFPVATNPISKLMTIITDMNIVRTTYQTLRSLNLKTNKQIY